MSAENMSPGSPRAADRPRADRDRRRLATVLRPAVPDRDDGLQKAFFGTALGYAWSLLRPLLLFGVLLIVFTQVFRVGSSSIEHYPVFLLTNIVLFTFFQEATMVATTSVAAREGIVRKTQFPRLVIPMSIVLTSSFNLGMNICRGAGVRASRSGSLRC